MGGGEEVLEGDRKHLAMSIARVNSPPPSNKAVDERARGVIQNGLTNSLDQVVWDRLEGEAGVRNKARLKAMSAHHAGA